MSDNYFDSRYLTLVGYVQSGKTIEEINYCYRSIHEYQVPVIFIVRNITADQLQLRSRFNKSGLEIKLLNTLTQDKAIEFMESLGVIILLCNEWQLQKIRRIINLFTGKYNLCIDEVDFSIKSKDLISPIDTLLKDIKKKANHILGATATPFALFSSEKSLSKVRRIKPNENYRGIETLNVNYVDSCIIRSEDDFPLCDMGAMDTIYESFNLKDHGVILHTVVKERENHYKIQRYLSHVYPNMTVVVYNGDGIKIICKHRNNKPFADSKELNGYRQLINRYNLLDDNIHYFQNYSISEVLQLLVDDPEYNHTHISIISGHLASRGISFVSTDYSLHLTDQYYYASKSAHGENLLQSLRILGCYQDTAPLTLWVSKKTWKSIELQNKIINNLVNGVDNSMNWMAKIKEVSINKPNRKLTRPNLCNYAVKSNNDNFVLDIFYPPDELVEE